MHWQPRRFKSAISVVAVGLVWLMASWSAAWPVAVIGSVPGIVLIAAGAGQFLWAGDRQLCYHMALAGLVSAVMALVLGFWLGWFIAVVLIAGGGAAFIVAGWALRIQHPVPAAIAPPPVRFRLLSKMATDAALLGFFINCARVPRGRAVETDICELAEFAALAEAENWHTEPERLHGGPRAWTEPHIVAARSRGIDYEWLTAESRYRPDPRVPGLARWQGYRRNRQASARILRHDDATQRDWLVCIHGYRMGMARLDFQLFDAHRLHRRLGLNLAMPVLPLHGHRRATPLTGGLFLDGPLADLIHAQAQSLCDLRSTVAWIRAEDPGARIGVLGYSLGGYHAALLAAYEPELACVIAGIPMVDIPATLWQHLPTAHARYLEARGLSAAYVAECLTCVSPLGRPPRVAHDRRHIFAATADQLIAPEQPLALWRHWDEPALQWYDGSHVSVRHETDIAPFIDRALAEAGLSKAL